MLSALCGHRRGSGLTDLAAPVKARLLPVRGLEPHVSANRPEVGLVAGNERRADTPGRECDQDVEGEIPDLAGVVAIAALDARQDLGRVDPVPFRRRHDAAVPLEITDELALYGRSGSSEQLVQDDCRAAGDEHRFEDLAREAAGSEILDVDRSVKDAKPSLP